MSYLPDTKWTIIFTVTLVLQGLLVVALEACLFVLWHRQMSAVKNDYNVLTNISGVLPAQLSTICIETIYQVVLFLDAIRLRNIVQAYGIVVNNLSILVFTILGLIAVHDAHDYLAHNTPDWHLKWPQMFRVFVVLLAVLAASTLFLAIAAWKLSSEFAW
jgi:hypothetical protein